MAYRRDPWTGLYRDGQGNLLDADDVFGPASRFGNTDRSAQPADHPDPGKFSPQIFLENVFGFAYMGDEYSKVKGLTSGRHLGRFVDPVSDVDFKDGSALLRSANPTAYWRQTSYDIRVETLDGGSEKLSTNFEVIVTAPPKNDQSNSPSDVNRRLNAFDFALRTLMERYEPEVYNIDVIEEDFDVGARYEKSGRISRRWEFSVRGSIVGESPETA